MGSACHIELSTARSRALPLLSGLLGCGRRVLLISPHYASGEVCSRVCVGFITLPQVGRVGECGHAVLGYSARCSGSAIEQIQ